MSSKRTRSETTGPPTGEIRTQGVAREFFRAIVLVTLLLAAVSLVGLWTFDEPARGPFEPGVCAHPWVPSTLGMVLHYAWTTGGGRGALELELGSVRSEGDSVVLRWRSRMSGAGSPVDGGLDCSCSAARAQEPWFGFAMPGGVDVAGATWWWPADLSSDVRFDGTYELGSAGRSRSVTRYHVVRGRRPVQVPAGSFDALVVETEDVGDRPGPPLRGTFWLVERIGAVRWEQHGSSGSSTFELARVERGRQ